MPDTEDGKVTLAVLKTQLDNVLTVLEEIKRLGANRDARVTKIEMETIPALDRRVTDVEPTVRTIRKIGEIALYIFVVAAIGGIIWAAIQSGTAFP